MTKELVRSFVLFFFLVFGGVEAFIDWAILLNDGVTWAVHLMLDGGL